MDMTSTEDLNNLFVPEGSGMPGDYMDARSNDAQQNRKVVDDSRAAWAQEIDRDNNNGKDENPQNNPAQQTAPYLKTAFQARGFRKRQARKNVSMTVVASTQSETLAGSRVVFQKDGVQIVGSVLVVGDKEFAVVWDDRKASMEKKSDYQLAFKSPQS